VYTAVLKQLTVIDNLFILVVITMAANFVGTWIGIEVTEKLRKADLWTINTVVKAEYLKDYKKALNEANIKYISYQTTWDECSAVDIFSETRAESKAIKKILEQFNVKYSIHTSHKKL
jgi:hypothetical protein